MLPSLQTRLKGQSKAEHITMASKGKGRGKWAFIDRKTHFLSVDAQVEVSSDEEGFTGAWYVATILKSPCSSRKNPAKGKSKVFVMYHTLLSDNDENEPLTEFVDASYIRPLPPPPDIDQSYEPNDVVDAFHRDGWWKAVVTKVEVLEEKSNSKRYTVIFENPPEQFDFCPAELRFHWDWINGRWVRPPKQKVHSILFLISCGFCFCFCFINYEILASICVLVLNRLLE